MDGASIEPDGRRGSPTVAMIGGGFTGACLALHLAHAACRILVFEPRPVIGPGLAYSTTDAMHRINAPAQRMSMLPDDPSHFCRWIVETGACLDDAQALLPDGRLFPRRAVFGRYVAAQLAAHGRAGRIMHYRTEVDCLEWQNSAWSITCTGATRHHADIVILATGHPPPSVPVMLTGAAAHPRFIANPLLPGALSAIGQEDRVLIVGTGLTMADTIASLDRAGHSGKIQAVSRRGQWPREHAGTEQPPYGDFAMAPDTALALVRRVRAVVADAAASGVPWQSVFETLRCQAQDIWLALPEPERRRLIRHARPYWESHRHRLPPATAGVLRRRLLEQTLTIDAASISAAKAAGDQIQVTMRWRGAPAAVQERFEAVILTVGPGRIAKFQSGLIGNLLRAGLISLDDTGLGLRCGETGRSIGKAETPSLFLAGSLTRGSRAEIISVPEISRQAAAIAQHIAAFEFSRLTI